MRTITHTQGFTIIELLLSLTVIASLLLGLSVFLTATLEAQATRRAIAEVEEQGAFTMHVITQTIRNADAINTPAAGTSAATLSLDRYGTANDPTVFDLAASAIRMQEGVGAATVLTSPAVVATNLSFSNRSLASTPGTIQIQFTLSHTNPSGRAPYSYAKTFYGSATLR